MSDFDLVEIDLDDCGKGSVSINGQPLKATLGVSFTANANQITEVTIRMVAAVKAKAPANAASMLIVHHYLEDADNA